MNGRTLFITGTGALAQAIIETLSAAPLNDLRVHIYGRNAERARWLATIGNARAASFGRQQHYAGAAMSWHSERPLSYELQEFRPFILIHAASLQSMWTLARSNAWSRLVKEVGYGITLPLQCVLAAAIGRTIETMETPPLFINCCYPDAVNHVLTKNRIKVLCGIGNIGIIESILNAQGVADFRMLANHVHVQELMKEPGERTIFPRVWIDEKEADARTLFNDMRLVNDPSLNSITAAGCIRLLSALVEGDDALLHLPGPSGLPGGYPVEIRSGCITAVGTGFVAQAEECAWNAALLEREGIAFDGEGVRFSEPAFKGLAQYSPALAKGFRFSEMDDYLPGFSSLVQRLLDKP